MYHSDVALALIFWALVDLCVANAQQVLSSLAMDPADANGPRPAPARSMRWMPNPGESPAYPDHAAAPATPAPTHQIGELIDGRYRLERSLGAGALTETWEATHVELAR